MKLKQLINQYLKELRAFTVKYYQEHPNATRKELDRALGREVRRLMKDKKAKLEKVLDGVSFDVLKDFKFENTIADQVVRDFTRWGAHIDSQVRNEMKDAYREGLTQRELRDRVEQRVRGGKRHGETWINTAGGAINRAETLQTKIAAGAKYFKFTGPKPDRSFCSAHYGKVYTLEEIEKLDNGQGLPVLLYCGGYNCRHRWVAVDSKD